MSGLLTWLGEDFNRKNRDRVLFGRIVHLRFHHPARSGENNPDVQKVQKQHKNKQQDKIKPASAAGEADPTAYVISA
jgi:hypothetical protein